MAEHEDVIFQGRSLAETPTWSVASVVTLMVFVSFVAERSIHRAGTWLRRTRKKALLASLEKIKEELMVLGLISLLLGECGKWISEICVKSSYLNSRFYACSVEEYYISQHHFLNSTSPMNETDVNPRVINGRRPHHCSEGQLPFVSYESLLQLNRLLFVLGITHVLYSCAAVALAMVKIYSWRKWESQAGMMISEDLQARKSKFMQRQTTFVFQHTSHPWSRNQILIWMLCFLQQFKNSIQKSDYLALRLGFIANHDLPSSYNFHKYMIRSMEDEFYGIVGISWLLWSYAILSTLLNIHGLNIYFWMSFIPVVLVLLVGTKLQHVVSSLALEIMDPEVAYIGPQVKPRDDLFWFGKPDILLRLLQFISFQNAFELATFIWTLWGAKQESCFMRDRTMIIIRLVSAILVQFWCSYSTMPTIVLVMQMGSHCRKALVAERVRDSLHHWCKRARQRPRRGCLLPRAARSPLCLGTISYELEEFTAIRSATSSFRASSMEDSQQNDITALDPTRGSPRPTCKNVSDVFLDGPSSIEEVTAHGSDPSWSFPQPATKTGHDGDGDDKLVGEEA